MRWIRHNTDRQHAAAWTGGASELSPLCAATRAALSAQLDGEPLPELTAELAAHLGSCAPCRVWQESLHRLTRRFQLAAADELPDRTPAVLAAVMADRDRPRFTTGRRPLQLTRIGLAAASLAQLVIVIPALIMGNAGTLVPPHASRELGAFNLALAVGFLTASLRPTHARGALPLAIPAVGLLAILAGIDTWLGQTTLLAETPHLIAVAGTTLLFWLARVTPKSAIQPPRIARGAPDMTR